MSTSIGVPEVRAQIVQDQARKRSEALAVARPAPASQATAVGRRIRWRRSGWRRLNGMKGGASIRPRQHRTSRARSGFTSCRRTAPVMNDPAQSACVRLRSARSQRVQDRDSTCSGGQSGRSANKARCGRESAAGRSGRICGRRAGDGSAGSVGGRFNAAAASTADRLPLRGCRIVLPRSGWAAEVDCSRPGGTSALGGALAAGGGGGILTRHHRPRWSAEPECASGRSGGARVWRANRRSP